MTSIKKWATITVLDFPNEVIRSSVGTRVLLLLHTCVSTQLAFACLKLTIETPEPCVKYVQS